LGGHQSHKIVPDTEVLRFPNATARKHKARDAGLVVSGVIIVPDTFMAAGAAMWGSAIFAVSGKNLSRGSAGK
jgi:hypothetical protein